MKRKNLFSSPKQNSPRGVGFFQQFPRQFLRPYGEAEKAPSTDTVFKRIKPFTCEWLLRPKVALSEFADTMLKNTALIKDQANTVLTAEFVKAFTNHMKPLTRHLNNLHKDSQREPSEEDVVETLEFLYQENDDFDALIDEMFQVGGALFVTAVQHIVARTLIRFPEEYGEIVQADNESDATFQNKKDIVSMRDFLVNGVIGKATQKSLTSPRKNLIAQSDSPKKGHTATNEDALQANTSSGKRARPPSIPVVTASSDSSSESSDNEHTPPPKKRAKETKGTTKVHAKPKRNPLELLASDETSIANGKKAEKKTEKKANKGKKSNK